MSIDYDPGASEVNQLNRIKLMVATAHKNAGTLSTWTDADSEFEPTGREVKTVQKLVGAGTGGSGPIPLGITPVLR